MTSNVDMDFLITKVYWNICNTISLNNAPPDTHTGGLRVQKGDTSCQHKQSLRKKFGNLTTCLNYWEVQGSEVRQRLLRPYITDP